MGVAEHDFPVSRRLNERADYDWVFKNTDYRHHDNGFMVLASEGKSERGRLGIIVAKRNINKAVYRNRFKRITREAFRKASDHHLDIIVLAKSKGDELSKQDLFERLTLAFNKLIQKAEGQRDQALRD